MTDGGESTNVVPAYAEGLFGLRGATTGALEELAAELESCAQGVAGATGTKAEVTPVGTGYRHFRNNRALSDRFTHHIGRAGDRGRGSGAGGVPGLVGHR